ncbi:hypothetical protein D9M69_684850 [compost metagenome]
MDLQAHALALVLMGRHDRGVFGIAGAAGEAQVAALAFARGQVLRFVAGAFLRRAALDGGTQ